MTEYTIKNPDAPMSDKQSYLLYRITGITLYYLESKPFTVKQASDLIDQAKNGHVYRVRLQLADHGGKISSPDVHKDYRSQTKPRGYATAMKAIIGNDKPAKEPVKKPAAAKKKSTKKPQTLAEELGLDNVDPDDPRIQAVKAMFKPVTA